MIKAGTWEILFLHRAGFHRGKENAAAFTKHKE